MSQSARQSLNYNIPVTSPIGYGITNLGNVSEQVIAANVVREKLMFFNPNAAVTIWLVPAPSTATKGGGSIPLYSGSGPYTVSGENVGAAWNAIADSGSNNGLTILEFL